MENNQNKYSFPEISREDIGHVAYMSYLLNRTQTIRWYYQWTAYLEQKTSEGWTSTGFFNKGLIRQKLEHVYGLSECESMSAVETYPLVNMGLAPWETITEQYADSLAEDIYRSYAGLARKGNTGCHPLCIPETVYDDGEDDNDWDAYYEALDVMNGQAGSGKILPFE